MDPGRNICNTIPFLTHLGINRYVNNIASDADDIIKDRVSTARKTAYMYSLMCSVFQCNGRVNNQCFSQYLNAFVLPRLLYALESLVVMQKQKEALDVFLKDILKVVQALTQGTANEAPYLLFGILPVEALLHINILSFFGKLIHLLPNL